VKNRETQTVLGLNSFFALGLHETNPGCTSLDAQNVSKVLLSAAAHKFSVVALSLLIVSASAVCFGLRKETQ